MRPVVTRQPLAEADPGACRPWRERPIPARRWADTAGNRCPGTRASEAARPRSQERDEKALVTERNGSLLRARRFFITLLAHRKQRAGLAKRGDGSSQATWQRADGTTFTSDDTPAQHPLAPPTTPSRHRPDVLHRTPWHRPPGQVCGAAQVSGYLAGRAGVRPRSVGRCVLTAPRSPPPGMLREAASPGPPGRDGLRCGAGVVRRRLPPPGCQGSLGPRCRGPWQGFPPSAGPPLRSPWEQPGLGQWGACAAGRPPAARRRRRRTRPPRSRRQEHCLPARLLRVRSAG